jgi:hypothetical protein
MAGAAKNAMHAPKQEWYQPMKFGRWPRRC